MFINMNCQHCMGKGCNLCCSLNAQALQQQALAQNPPDPKQIVLSKLEDKLKSLKEQCSQIEAAIKQVREIK
jgi:hypothetical protein